MQRALLVVVCFWLVSCAPPAPSVPPTVPRPATPTATPPVQLSNLRVGWAYEAYPGASSGKILADFSSMVANGANAVWIGHNNPGEVDANKVEPGLSYAVYAALQDAADPNHQDAVAMTDAVKRALDAARETKLQVVLPVGYQIQMGAAWNRKYPNELRKKQDGSPLELYHSGYTASPYSAQYRSDISHYYKWIQDEWVVSYQDVIVMLSLADEPLGGDYSDAAKQAFATKYGKPMDALLPDEVWKVGEFQAGVIADYATWSANTWKQLNPQMTVTISFDGAAARRQNGLPEIERLFAEAPDNFLISFDAYLHDDLPAKPVTDLEIQQLKLFLATIGFYSRVYNKPLALWGGVNAWGLAQSSSAPRTVSDGYTNLQLLYDLPTRAGGQVWGIFAWNYNIKGQGLEQYNRTMTFDPAAMETAVQRAFVTLRTRERQGVSGIPEVAVVVSRRDLYDALAQTHASDLPPTWQDGSALAPLLADRNASIVSAGETLDAAKDTLFYYVVAIALDMPTLDFLKQRVKDGATIVTDEANARALGLSYETWAAGWTKLPTAPGVVYVVREQNPLP